MKAITPKPMCEYKRHGCIYKIIKGAYTGEYVCYNKYDDFYMSINKSPRIFNGDCLDIVIPVNITIKIEEV